MSLESLFTPFKIGNLEVPNRIVMSPMTRCFSPNGIPGEGVPAYYRRRAEGGAGLLITEATHVPHPGAANDPDCPNFHGKKALEEWKKVLAEVHAAGGRILPQLWHVGLLVKAELENLYGEKGQLSPDHVGPSGFAGGMGQALFKAKEDMTRRDIDNVICAYGKAANTAMTLGFDGIEIHAAHGYLIDQFFWGATNQREDDFGGGLVDRTRFGALVVQECRANTSPDFPIFMRISQWKGQEYDARLVQDPAELELFLAPLVDAGVDLFDCSQRRFWEPAFDGSKMSFAGWVKNISDRPTMTVGSVSLDTELIDSLYGTESRPVSLDRLLTLFERNEFDLVGVGRAMIVDPDWALKVQRGDFDSLRNYSADALAALE